MSSDKVPEPNPNGPVEIDAAAETQSCNTGQVRESAFKQDFNLWSTLGIGFSYVATPLSIGTYLAFSLSAGGSPFFFYTYLVCFFFNFLVALSLAEIAAILPHTSGKA